jgi:hypothetical protein
VAARAGAGAAAGRSKVNTPIANNLHDTPALDCWQSVLATSVIDDEKENLVGAGLLGGLFQD